MVVFLITIIIVLLIICGYFGYLVFSIGGAFYDAFNPLNR